ncbi:hypothetical protein L1987_74321 [Smallanthus sonchifolius]|uniref:Uncharacterized protein n=1 Tax=Smallanthus sonchifolius TaxID=185202 RepID=A0ACB9A2R3_9ASTR|nr:hypothetical protein L1987_74321 [Smallanthus sonchifolius]
MELRTLKFLCELQYDENLPTLVANGIGCLNRKLGRCVWPGVGELEAEMERNVVRRKLAEESLNLAAALSPSDGIGPPKIIALPTTRSSGSFSVVPNHKKAPPPPLALNQEIISSHPPAHQAPGSESYGSSNLDKWKIWVIISFCILLLMIIAINLWCMCQSRAVKTIGPWKTGISGRLQKAFVTGVPKLHHTELETACEDFSNIIETTEGYTLYKGTLSSGVEICVALTPIASLKDWSKRAELGFRKKVAEVAFWSDLISKAKVSLESELEHSALSPLIDTETNVYCFGILMLEIVSGELPHSDQQGPIGAWTIEIPTPSLADLRSTIHNHRRFGKNIGE